MRSEPSVDVGLELGGYGAARTSWHKGLSTTSLEYRHMFESTVLASQYVVFGRPLACYSTVKSIAIPWLT